MSSRERSVAVIGGGIVGASCAYYLQKAGWAATIIDKGQFGRACSHGNCGYVCPSHVLPLTEPGAASRAFKALFQKNSPFYIKPSLDAGLWSWLLRFASRCNESCMLEAARGLRALLDSSMNEYLLWMQSEKLDCEWERNGLLFVYLSAREFEHYAATDRLLRERFNVPARRLDSAELLALEPALKPEVAGAWHYENDAQLRPDKLMTSLRKHLESSGVQILEQCDIRRFEVSGGRANAAVHEGGRIEASTFVVAAGAWTPLLAKELGCRIPIQPGKGYSMTMRRPKICPKRPMMFQEHRVACSPFPSGYRLGSMMEFAGYDTTLNPRRLRILKDAAALYLREPFTETVEEEWYGWRPMTYDGLPIIDRSPRLQNVMIAAGHNMLGLSLATGTGKLVAEMLCGSTPHVDPAPYSAARF